MKTPSEDIFKLIKSLDPQEKVYYKRITDNKSESKNYIKVFDIIHNMKNYDEEEVKKKLNEEGISGNFKHLKSRTFDSIVKSLCEYHSNTSFKRIIQDHIYKAEIFVNKNLLNAAEKELNKAENLAKKAKNSQFLIEINNLKIGYYRKGKLLSKIENYYNSGQFDISLENVESIAEGIRLNKQSTKLVTLHLKTSNTQSDAKEMSKLSQSIFNKEPSHYKTHSALIQYYNNYFIYDITSRTFNEKSLNRQLELIKYYEEENDLLKYRAKEYITSNINLITIYASLRKGKEMDTTFQKINNFYALLPSKHKTENVKELLNRSFLNYIGNLVNLNEFKKAVFYWENESHNIDINTLRDTTFIILEMNLLIIYFSLGNYHVALKHANSILNFKSKQVIDVQVLSRIFSLIIHYELNNFEVLPYLTKQSKSFVQKHAIHPLFFMEMLQFFSNPNLFDWDKEEKRNAFISLSKKIKKVFKNAEEAKVLGDFDFISWIDSKIETRSFSEVVKEKDNRKFSTKD